MPPTRRCTGKTKAGKPCKANPLKGKKHCSAHDPLTPASARFGSHAQATEAGKLGGRPPAPRAVDVLRERLEANVDQWLAPLEDALTADMGVTVGFGKDAYLEMVPDHRTRLRALEMMLDRVHGRPKQTQEITGADGGPVEMVPVARERGPDVVRILAGTGVLPVPVPNGNGNGNGHAAHN